MLDIALDVLPRSAAAQPASIPQAHSAGAQREAAQTAVPVVMEKAASAHHRGRPRCSALGTLEQAQRPLSASPGNPQPRNSPLTHVHADVTRQAPWEEMGGATISLRMFTGENWNGTYRSAPPEGRANTPHLRRLLHKVHLPFRGAWPRASPRDTKPGRGSTRTVNR